MRTSWLWLGVSFVFVPVFTAGRAQVPASASTIVWRTDWNAAREEAGRSGKPLFVLLRCPQTKSAQTASLPVEQPTDKELQTLLSTHYVPVRLHSLKDADLNTLRFDYDLTLAGLVVDGRDRTVLARWGVGGDAPMSDRYNVSSLKAMLDAGALVYQKRAPGVSPPPVQTITERYPAFATSRRAGEPCYHCHYVHDAALADARTNNTFEKSWLYLFPPPQNIGVTLDPNRGNVVTSVAPDSPAQRARVRPGDVITQVNQTLIYTTADFSWALNAISNNATTNHLTLHLVRDNKPLAPVTLTMPPNWKAYDISWRPSQGAVGPILGTWEEPVPSAERAALGLSATSLALRVTTLFSGPKWEPTHGDLRVGDIFVAVGNKALPDLSARQFHSYVRMHYNVGGSIAFTVLRDGKRITVPVSAVNVSLE